MTNLTPETLRERARKLLRDTNEAECCDSMFAHASAWAADRKRIEALEGATPEQVARLFHDAYEELARDYNWETRPETAVPWDFLPESNRGLMMAVAERVLAALRSEEER